MKHLNLLLLLIGTILFVFSCSEDDSTSPEQDQANQVTMFTGTENPVAVYNEGTVTPLPSGLALVEGGVFEYRDESSDPRITGKVMVYATGIFDSTFCGPCWATGEFTPDNGGSWDLRFIGERSVTEGSLGEVIAHGKGELDGLTALWTYKCLPGETEYTIEGFILEP
jgi:hypothetical protein